MKDLAPGARKMGKFVPNTQAELSIFDNITGKSVCMTERESALLSRLLQTAYFAARWGADDDMDEINAWVANLDQKLQIFEGCDTMDCDDVANCIDTSVAVSAALDGWIQNSGYNGGVGNINNPLGDTALNEDWMAGSACDSDKLWGACEEVIDGMFDATIELLQRLDQATNTTDLFADLLGAIPIIGGLLSFGYEVTTWAIETALPLFNAVDSPVVRQELACDLFCLCKDDCELTMNKVIETFNAAGVEEPPWSTEILPNLEWIVTLALSGNPDKAIAASIATLGVIIIKYGGRFGKIALGVQSMQQMAAYGAETNPNSGWTLACDCVDRWEEVFEFNLASGPWHIAFPDMGVYQMGLGWKHTDAILTPPYTRRAINTLTTDLQVVTRIDTVITEYTLVKGGYYTNSLIARALVKDPSPIVVDTVLFTPAGVVVWTEHFDEITTTAGIGLAIVAHDDFPAVTGQCSIQKVTLRGNGPNPFDV